MTSNPIHVLLVEDDPEDVDLTREALKEGPLACELSVVGDGIEAMDFLLRKGEYRDAPSPDVVLLDLNLPRKGGREVLAEIRATPGLEEILVVVLTSSYADREMVRAFKLDANFINKPITAAELSNVLKTPDAFFATAEKPRRRKRGKG